MQPAPGESTTWPTNQWDLPGPDSYVLLNGLDRPDTQPFKLAIMELVGRRVLKLVEIDESGVFGIRHRVNVLSEGDAHKSPPERSLAAMRQLFSEVNLGAFSDGTVGVKVEDFAAAAQRRYRPLSEFTKIEILPTLLERGYYVLEQRKFLGIFPTSRYVVTPSGQAARADLRSRMDLGEANMRGWVHDDPNRAFMYMALAGSSIFLMPMLFSDVGDLHQQQGDAAYASGMGEGGADAGALNAGLDLGSLDLGAFAGLDSAVGAIDAGIDSGIGGGDGGRGDGGGWGDGGGGGGDGGGGGGD
jgi:hypothetical protein